jgi:predicted GIY-YIG superfamily endonuclease
VERTALIGLVIFALAACPAASAPVLAQDSPAEHAGEVSKLREVVAEAFASTHDGWSSDEVILQDSLNRAFVDECRKTIADADAAAFNWTLLNLRKAGRLEATTSRSDDRPTREQLAAGEMAARMISDQHKVSVDRIMTDPQLKEAFDASVRAIDPEIDVYLARKAAFHLRKARRLMPELITRIADWDRKVTSLSVSELSNDHSLAPETPGVYIFRDRSGFLYIGEAADLRKRLAEHVTGSDRQSLSEYLAKNSDGEVLVEIHAFPADSRMREIAVRRAYESELIRSRNPRFNIRP